LEWERIFSYCGNLAYDAQGNPLMAVVTIDDITERKQAEEALRASDERFRISKQAAMLGIHDYDVSSGKIQWDEKVRELWAVGPDLPITYEVFKSGVHPDDLKEVQRALDRALDPNGNAKYYCEYRVTGIGDGIQRWVAATGQVFFDQGRAVRLVGTVQEITERKQSETRLAADLAALTRMHELSGRLLEIGGIQSLLQEIMDAAVSVVGAEKGTLQLLESDSLRIVAAHGHKQPFLDFFASAESQASVCGEATRRGERVIVSDVETSSLFIGTPSLAILRGAGVRAVQSTPMMSRTGELLGILTTQWGVPYTPDEHDLWRIDLLVRQAADLIEHSRAEEELRKSRDELELRVQERTAELKSYMAKLEQSNQALQDFASIASHDMKEPLRKVISFGNMLRQKSGKSLGETGNDYLNRMLNATERMQSLLAGLLDYSRVATASEPLKEVDLSDLISEVLSDLEVRIVRTGGEVHVGRLPVISADPTQMRQLFQNLIGNALKFHKPGEKPKVQVRSVSNTDEGCQIIVEDAGIGFEEQYLERIFAPFQRLHGRSSQYEGTGMGLAICKKIVERHGGSIAARSTPGEGATFIIEIPVKYTNRTES
ncbi:MAG: ATP-binding protein, partial [Syntrophobacteraceae bacterium]